MAELVESYACAPLTERGRGILISGDPKSNSIIYCNGRSVIIRYLNRLLHVRVYGEHSYQTTVARYSPNGEWVASADVSGILRIWGVHNDFVLKNEFKVLSGRIDDLQWSPDSLRIVASGDGKGKSFVRVFMWDTGTNVGDFDGHSRRVLSCSFKQTRPFRIATCGEDFSVNFYEGPPFKFKLSNRDHSNFVNCARFSPDGSKFITVGSDKKGILYDGKSGERSGELSSQDCHHGSIYAVSWSPDSKNVLTVSADKSAKVWEISGEGCGGELRKTLESCGSGEIEDMLVGCLWQNDSLITVSLGGCIRVFSAADLDAPPAIVTCGHMKNVTSLAMLHPQTLLSCSYDGSVFTWVRGVGYSARLKRKHNTPIKCFRAVHNHIVLSGFDNKVWRVSIDGEEESSVDVGSQPKDLSISPDFPDLVLVTTDSAIIILRGTEISSTADLAFTATSGALSDDATEAIIGGEDGRLHIYRITSDGLSAQATVVENHHRGAINAISYSPDRSMFASTDLNRGTLVWDRHTYGTKPLPQVRAKDMTYHTARVNCLAWSPDSRRIVTGSLDMSAIVYYIDRPASSRLTISRAHLGGVYGVVFADDSTVVTCGDDAFVRLWNLKA